jgi:hypothetical protein
LVLKLLFSVVFANTPDVVDACDGQGNNANDSVKHLILASEEVKDRGDRDDSVEEAKTEEAKCFAVHALTLAR